MVCSNKQIEPADKRRRLAQERGEHAGGGLD